ncbi:unnamed protein product [Peronospora farinosa]|uniref:Uncharacterized protein n=1 Tax=Peronospora farinosa TaxID=134698 RepID=A0ABN8CDS8_9STRA|nr:unnamed protein product [Peronospora farinosa]
MAAASRRLHHTVSFSRSLLVSAKWSRINRGHPIWMYRDEPVKCIYLWTPETNPPRKLEAYEKLTQSTQLWWKAVKHIIRLC